MTVALPGPLVSATWLVDHLDEVAVIDVRWYLDGRSGRAAYEAGHIPGARFADLDADLSAPPSQPGGRHPLPDPEDFAQAMGRLGIGDGTPVVAYDDASGMIAGRLWWMLDSLGEPAAVLDGGIAAWPGGLSTEPASPIGAIFTARPWPRDRFADADEVAARDPSTMLLDARSADRFHGEANDIDPRFGHIPGAVSAEWSANVGADGLFLDPNRLAERYRSLGVDPETEVIAYCGSGVSACTDLLALRLAGCMDARLYTGSWSDWGGDESRPLERG